MAYEFSRIISVEGRLCAIDSGFDRLNQGSVIETLFFPESDIVSMPAYTFWSDGDQAAEISGNLVLKSGAVGYRFRFTPDTGVFTENSQENDDGIYYDQLLSIRIPKDRPEITWLKQRMRNPRYAVIYRDANGNVKSLRNLRVKFDLNTGTNRPEYNGHTLQARRATDLPAIHWNIGAGVQLEDIYTPSALTLDSNFYSLPAGWQSGKQLVLNSAPVNSEAIRLVYNSSLLLRAGEHYVLSGSTITLLFDDAPDDGGAGTLFAIYGTNVVGTDISGFVQGVDNKNAAYSSGETITLPSAPISVSTLTIIYNKVLSLRPGIEYSLSGSTATLLFAGDPAGDVDTFDFFYATGGTALAITGWKQYAYPVNSSLPSGSTFDLPHTPIANSLIVTLDDSLLLTSGTDFNLNTNEIEILFDMDAGSRIDCWYAY